MRDSCSVDNENHFAICSANKEQDEKSLRDAERAFSIEPEKAHTNSIDSDGKKNLEPGEKVDKDKDGKDSENETSQHSFKHKGYESNRRSGSADIHNIDLSDEARSYKERKVETPVTTVPSGKCQQESLGNGKTPKSTIKLTGSSFSRKRKLDSFKSTPADSPKAILNEDISKRNRLMSSCLSRKTDGNKDALHSDQRRRSWLNCEDLKECSENVADDTSDDDYNGVDEIELSEDESQLTFLEEKYIIDSELCSIRGHCGAFVGDDLKQSLSESDFPELFGHPDDSVPTYTSDAGFLYETNFPSSRKYFDSPTKRVRFEDHTRIADLCVQNIDVLDSDINSDDLSDHASLHASFLASQSCDVNGIVMQKSDDVKDEVHGNVDSGNGSHINSVQSTSTSICDDSDFFEASSSDFDSDGGDTTDEEDPPAHAHIHNPHSKLQRKLSPSLSEHDSSKYVANPRSFRRNGPVMGQFVVDPRKAVVVLDNRKLKLFPARLPRTSLSSTDSSDSTSNECYQTSRQLHNIMTQNSLEFFGATPLDIMLCGVFSSNTGPHSLRGQVIGPPEAFYPFTTVTFNGTIASNDDDLYDYDDNDESIKNLHELIDFGDASDTDFGKETSTELASGVCDTVRKEMLADNGAGGCIDPNELRGLNVL